MKRLIAAVLLSASFAPLHAVDRQASEPPRPDDFAVQFPLTDVADGLNALELNEAVYRAATQRRLNDLRVFNAAGEALPLALLPPVPQAPPDVHGDEHIGVALLRDCVRLALHVHVELHLEQPPLAAVARLLRHRHMEPVYLQRLRLMVDRYGAARGANRGDDALPQVALAAVVGRVDVLLLERDRRVEGSMGQTHVNRWTDDLLRRIEAGQIDPSFVITHTVSLAAGPQMYRTFRAKEDGCIKVVLKPEGARRTSEQSTQGEVQR